MDFLLPSQSISATEAIPSPTITQQHDAEDHVMWQSSQSIALKELLHTPDEGVRTSRGWQREPSFDQIPGFSRLSTSDASTPSTSARPALARPRRAQSPAIPSTSELPFKADPIQLLHLMRDVSARLDQNVPVRPRSSLGPDRIKTDRRIRSSATPFPSSRPAKKSRIESLRSGESDGGIPAIDKGKVNAQPAEIQSPSQEFTPSQIQMPPPPGAFSEDHSLQTIGLARHHQQPRQANQPCFPPETPTPSARPTKPQLSRVQTPVPRLSTVDKPAAVALDRRQTHSPTIQSPTHTIAAQPPTASQSAARPPSLGMRRTNTFPMATSLHRNVALPTRQKGFKPPLLSSSQPQASSQQRAPTSNALRPSGCTGGLSRSSSESPSASSSFSSSTTTSTSTTTTMASSVSSSRSARSSASPAPFEYSAQKADSSKSSSAPRVAPMRNSAPVSKQTTVPDDDAVDSLPEPLDGDPESSFGDMSFDMDADALEAMMRLYD